MAHSIEDPLSSALRGFSQQLTSISLQSIVVGQELFWPNNPTANTQLPFWPNLISFQLTYGIATPYGEWYFERGPAEDTEFGLSDANTYDQYPDYLRPPVADRYPDQF